MNKENDNEMMKRVWDRVAGEPDGDTQRSAMEDFIIYEEKMRDIYSKMAQKISARADRQTVFSMAEECRSDLKKLQKMYFLIYGNNFPVPHEKSELRSVLSSMRECYLAEINQQTAYERAAVRAENSRISIIFNEVAQSCFRHAMMLEGLTEKIIG